MDAIVLCVPLRAPGCTSAEAQSLHNWDIDGRVNVLYRRDIHCSLYLLTRRHLSLHQHRDVRSALCEIVFGRSRDLPLVQAHGVHL